MKDLDFNLSSSGVRIALVALLAAFIYGVIALQLWNVQIRQGEDHRQRVSKQYARKIRIPAVRGRIFSADGRLLADNRPSYNILFHLSEMRQPGRGSKTVFFILDEYTRLAKAIGREPEITEKDIIAQLGNPSLPMCVFRDLDPKELGRAAEISPDVPGLEISPEPMREYPERALASNIIGYVGQDDPSKAEDRSEFSFYIPDIVGRGGIERAFDDFLRGSPGKKLVIVNHRHFVQEVVGMPTPAQNGGDVYLTIDAKAQRAAEREISNRQGAVVVLDAKTGAVLVMATSPSFDPNLFVPKISRKVWDELNTDRRKPMLNRPALGEYTPGSIMKPLVATSLLENGLSPSFEVVCDGGTTVGNARIKCWSWRSGGHGAVNIEHAIEQSCNDFFIENGLRLGVDKLRETLASAGLGTKTGFQLPEGAGLLPSKEMKKERDKRAWNEFDTALLCIGQGMVEITPLQAAVYAAAIANGGTLWKPYVLSCLRDPSGNVTFRQMPSEKGALKVSPQNLDIVRHGMRLSVSSQKGSSKWARNSKIELSGKTGTAEMGPKSDRYSNTWFIGFGEDATGRLLSIAVFIERGESGGRTCAPIAARIFNAWLPEPEDK